MEAVALRQLAAAQILPTINLGMNYDNHTGILQQSNGNILASTAGAVYVGAGANAVAAGTVNIPGVVLAGNIAEGVFGWLVGRQVVAQRVAATRRCGTRRSCRSTLAYSELLRAEGRGRSRCRSATRRRGRPADRRLRQVGQGRQADAHRAAAELAEPRGRRPAGRGRGPGRLGPAWPASINLDPSIRLHPTDAFVVPLPIVPDPIPVRELIALALLQRPELAERRAVIREALLALEGAKVLPFSPTVIIGFSAGGFGGGSNLVRPVFGGFGGRSDFDAVALLDAPEPGRRQPRPDQPGRTPGSRRAGTRRSRSSTGSARRWPRRTP